MFTAGVPSRQRDAHSIVVWKIVWHGHAGRWDGDIFFVDLQDVVYKLEDVGYDIFFTINVIGIARSYGSIRLYILHDIAVDLEKISGHETYIIVTNPISESIHRRCCGRVATPREGSPNLGARQGRSAHLVARRRRSARLVLTRVASTAGSALYRRATSNAIQSRNTGIGNPNAHVLNPETATAPVALDWNSGRPLQERHRECRSGVATLSSTAMKVPGSRYETAGFSRNYAM